MFNADDVREIFGANPEYTLSYARYRVENASGLVGLTFYSGYIYLHKTILALSLLDSKHAAPGTEVTVHWGEATEPGSIRKIRATVQPAPYNEFARTQYRQGTI